MLSVLQSLVADVNREINYRLSNVAPRLVAFIDDLTTVRPEVAPALRKSDDDRDKASAYATVRHARRSRSCSRPSCRSDRYEYQACPPASLGAGESIPRTSTGRRRPHRHCPKSEWPPPGVKYTRRKVREDLGGPAASAEAHGRPRNTSQAYPPPPAHRRRDQRQGGQRLATTHSQL